MDNITEKSLQTQRRKFNRRDFFKGVGLVAAGAAVSSFLPDANGNMLAGNLGTRLIAHLFVQKDNEEASETSRLLREEAGEKNNPNYRPYLEILKEGINEFQSKNPATPVVWDKSPLYVGDYDTINLLTRPIKKEEVEYYSEGDKYEGKILLECIKNVVDGGNPGVVYGIFYNRLPEEIKNVINTVNANMVAMPGTELYEKFYPKSGNVFSHEDVTRYYEQIKRDFEVMYNQKQEPLPLSKLTVYFLEKNNGKLSPALGDMAGFLKYLIRGDDTEHSVVQIEWFRTHIQDQINRDFSLNKIRSLEDLPDGETKDSVKSIWGLLYHVPSLVYLLPYISPDLVRLATVYEYVSHKHEAEGYKLKTDAEFMDSLNTISDHLQSFRKNKRNYISTL
jgi:hypothetical protein